MPEEVIQYDLNVNCRSFEGTSLPGILWKMQAYVAILNLNNNFVEDITFCYEPSKGYLINLFWRSI